MKVGDYVRTKYGITQFKAYETINGNKLLCMPVKDGSNGIFANIEDVIKSSPSIIDLVQVGDYVNGEKVIDIGERGLYLGYADDNEHYSRIFIDESEIKTIVTREQFSNMEYRV